MNKARVIALNNVAALIRENKTSGETAELGVFQGSFAKHINQCFPNKKLYLFDTFEGFVQEDIAAELPDSANQISAGTYRYTETSEDLVIRSMPIPENCIIKKGYFPETAVALEEQYSFISLDADLYKPTLDGLIYFYPRLSSGGVIFIHDYFSTIFTGVKQAVLEHQKQNSYTFTPLGDGLSVAITKGWDYKQWWAVYNKHYCDLLFSMLQQLNNLIVV